MNNTDVMKPDAKRLLDACRDLKQCRNFADVSRLLGESEQTLTNWKRRGIPKGKTVSICKIVGCRPEWLELGLPPVSYSVQIPTISHGVLEKRVHYSLESNVEVGPDIKGRIPLISGVQAGMWSESVDIYEPGYAERWLPFIKKDGENTFALRVVGDSMVARFGKSYPAGCIIFINPDIKKPNNGDRIVAKLRSNGDVVFKVFTEEAGKRWLRPLNESYPPIYEDFVVVGKVTGKWEDE